jgi:tetratricopeptide (TPR) repeat protein
MNQTLDSKIKCIEERIHAGDPEAHNQVSKLIEHYPNKVEVWALRAYLLGRKGNWGEAINDLTHALDLLPSEPGLFFDRGRYYAKIGEHQCAVDDFTNALELCVFHSNDYYRESLYFFRAEAYLRLGNKVAALEDLQGVRKDFSLWTNELRTKQELLDQCSMEVVFLN